MILSIILIFLTIGFIINRIELNIIKKNEDFILNKIEELRKELETFNIKKK